MIWASDRSQQVWDNLRRKNCFVRQSFSKLFWTNLQEDVKKDVYG